MPWWPVTERIPTTVSHRRVTTRALVADAERTAGPDLVASAWLSGRALVVLGKARARSPSVARSRVRRWARGLLRKAESPTAS